MTYTGYLQVEVGNKNGKSIMTNSLFDGVFKITRPVYLSSGMPLLILIHVGGGYVDGDTYHTDMTIHESARLAITTQASTKVYKSKNFGVRQSTNYTLKNNSELFVKQDALIPYKDANFIQQTHVHMSSSATFFYSDIITPGWAEDGRMFQYERVTSKMQIFVDDTLVVFDHLLLEPDEKFEQLMYLEEYSHIGTLFFIHPKVNEPFLEDLRDKLEAFSNQARIGVSMLSVRGMTMRILASSTTMIEKIFAACEELIGERFYVNNVIEWRKW